MKIKFLSSATTIIVVMGNFLFSTVTAQNAVDTNEYEVQICNAIERFVMKCYPLYFHLSLDLDEAEEPYDDFVTFVESEFDADDIGGEGQMTQLFNDLIYSGFRELDDYFDDEAESVGECITDAMENPMKKWILMAAGDASLTTSGKRWANRKFKSARRHARRGNYRTAMKRYMQLMLVIEAGINNQEKVLAWTVKCDDWVWPEFDNNNNNN